jgi:RNA polymerase sigma-70 factor, ECF subfamily
MADSRRYTPRTSEGSRAQTARRAADLEAATAKVFPAEAKIFPAAAAEDAVGDAGDGDLVDITVAVVLAQEGDEDAFRAVYRAVQPGLLRYLKALVGEDAEDVASEAWSQIARDLNSFAGDGDGFRGWAATVARHRALDLLRAQRRKPAAAYQIEVLMDQASRDDTAESAVEAMTTDAAIALIATLPPDQAEAVLLRVVMGLDAAAAGRVLGKRAGAVRTAAHRGLRRLASKLNPPTV